MCKCEVFFFLFSPILFFSIVFWKCFWTVNGIFTRHRLGFADPNVKFFDL